MDKNIVGTIPALVLKVSKRPLFKKLIRLMNDYGFVDKQLNDKLIKSIPKGNDVLIGSVGSSSFYFNPENSDESSKRELIAKYKELGVNPDSLDSLNSYYYHSLLYNKKLIIISLLESATPVLAHELGHMFEDLNGGWTRYLQGSSIVRRVSRSDRVKSITAFTLALFGNIISSYLAPIIISSPQLATEFMASKIGYDLLRSVGATEDQLNKTMKCLASAWGTYFLGSMTSSLNSQIKGMLIRYIIKR